VKKETKNHDIFDLFFAHFPSRREGTDNSEQRRFFDARELKNAVDKVFIDDSSALIFIIGNFNSTPGNHCVNEVVEHCKRSIIHNRNNCIICWHLVFIGE
jgi:hypothetical protein